MSETSYEHELASSGATRINPPASAEEQPLAAEASPLQGGELIPSSSKLISSLSGDSNQGDSDAAPYILIVDDVPVNLQALESILQTRGFRVLKATNGEQALELVAQEKPDLILLDVMMPKMNGYEVCQHLKENPETSKIPVIFLTGRNDSYSVIKGFASGALDYVVKPFHAPELLARINTHLELKRSRDTILRYNYLLDAEKRRAEQLLLNILPASIAGRLQNGERLIADKIDDATVIFADVTNFTHLSEVLSAEEIVALLNMLFSAFDDLADKFGVEKIKTMGDSYMAASGIPIQRPDHAEAAVNMALAMLHSLEQINAQTGRNLNIRIGIHSGPVIAGVIGVKKFIYDLWGDTVNTASRMESHGEPGKVHVSEAVYAKLQGKFEFQERGDIEVKGKGIMKTYFVTG
ncbi:MAG: adenylate/guanylate cyclase domain-containing protein [Bacteroidota bacterium]|nr:response regulator [Candidatus Kapabacteria bacterium]MDW8220613.1 adenylate/guanylate cyclase domain-containing protein [Bacteroidota bacterium]